MLEQDNVRMRLQRAAIALFGEKGYDRTTSAEIAARAGVTERTFFRHFPDKREVLFDGEAILRSALTAAIDDAPADVGPLDMLLFAISSVLPLLEANRPYSTPRQQIISVTPALQERELAKLAVLTDALAAGLQARGVAELAAALVARVGMTVFAHVTLAWLDDPEPGLSERLDRAWSELKALVAGSKPKG